MSAPFEWQVIYPDDPPGASPERLPDMVALFVWTAIGSLFRKMGA